MHKLGNNIDAFALNKTLGAMIRIIFRADAKRRATNKVVGALREMSTLLITRLDWVQLSRRSRSPRTVSA